MAKCSETSAAWMQEALKDAALAGAAGEVPVGAVAVRKGEIVGRGHNQVESTKDPTAHAEILAIRDASKLLGSWRLHDVDLYVTLEPCPMCIGACILARIHSLYFGCYDPRQGAVGSRFDLSDYPGLSHSIDVYPEVMAEESRTLLEDFFSELRKG